MASDLLFALVLIWSGWAMRSGVQRYWDGVEHDRQMGRRP